MIFFCLVLSVPIKALGSSCFFSFLFFFSLWDTIIRFGAFGPVRLLFLFSPRRGVITHLLFRFLFPWQENVLASFNWDLSAFVSYYFLDSRRLDYLGSSSYQPYGGPGQDDSH